MTPSHLVLSIVLGAVALGFTAGTAEAATARASAAITIYDGPGYRYAPIGKLLRNEVVRLAECTPSGRWCRIVHTGPAGWVLASYLVGSAAKVEATPFKPLVNPFREMFPRPAPKQP